MSSAQNNARIIGSAEYNIIVSLIEIQQINQYDFVIS